nr:nitroreductase family protein [Candidatus Sigynarchaeota archaeon]
MEFNDVIQKRHSVRKFKPDPVPMDVVKRVVNAARLAPSWANMQGVRYIIVASKEQVEKVANSIGPKWAKTAPMFVAAISDEKWSGKRGDLAYFMLDVGIAFEHLVLAATNEGLGTCWLGAFNEEKLKPVLDIQKKNRIVAMTPLGYPAEEPKASPRKELSEIAFLDRYGTAFE